MTEVVATVLHTAFQGVTGLAVGTLIDAVFPDPGPPLIAGNYEDLTWTALEVSAQLTVVGLATAAVVQATDSLPDVLRDPTGGIAYMITVMAAMPNMTEKVKRMTLYSRNILGAVTSEVVHEGQLIAGSTVATGNRLIVPRSQKQMANATM